MEKMDRRLDLSAKFMKMGQTLINEGKKEDDLGVAQIGTVLIFISGLLMGDTDDIFKFSELCSMFSSKKILDSLSGDDSPIKDLFNKKIDSNTYDDFIKKINDLRDKEKEDDEDLF